VISVEGRLFFQHATSSGPYFVNSTQITSGSLARMSWGHIPYNWNALGFAYAGKTDTIKGVIVQWQLLTLPYWFLTLASAILPATWLRKFIRRRRERGRASRGHCPACGYDLRASPDRCPECGTAASTKVAT